jgi:MFS family permease
LSCLGTALEYYDFIIYGMMASYLTEIFFPGDNVNINLVKTFSVLAVGYLARPLGGCLFGLLSDIYGRKSSLLLGMLLMAIMTVCIGLLPSYNKVGMLSTILLIICRFTQGLSFGAEIPSVTTLMKEYTQGKKIGKYFGWIISGTSLGALLASLMVFLINYIFSHAEIISWAWRIPFIMGAFLAFVVYTMRTTLPSTSKLIFMTTEQNNTVYRSSILLIKDLFKNHSINLFIGIFITLFFSYLITISLYLPIYLKQQFGFATKSFFSVMTIGILLSGITSPIFGYLGDRYVRTKLLQIISISFLVFLFYTLQMMKSGKYCSLVFFIFGYELFISAFSANCLPVLAELFPANIRATGIGLCYNLSFSLAALCPIILSHIIETNEHIFVISTLSSCIVLTTIIASYCLHRLCPVLQP